VHTVSAWASSHGVVLAQVAVDKKSNEITAIPKLLEMMDIRGAIITIDAMGCQKSIAEKIVEQGADYVLALKGNQKNLLNGVLRINFIDIWTSHLEKTIPEYAKIMGRQISGHRED
jgi:predicted transposase YbfD/YdcC